MVDKRDSNTQVLVFEDLDACNEQLVQELDIYAYEILALGLDCEWVSEARSDSSAALCPVALLQLAFPNGRCFLVRLCQMSGKLPDKLKDILEDRNILKAGVGIKEDAKKLSCCYGVVVQGCVDLRHVASRCRGYVQHCFEEGGASNSMGLSALSQQILGITLDKDWRIRCSDWEAASLTERQKQYAADDAIVAVRIFLTLALSKLKEKEERCSAGNALDKISGDNMIAVEASAKALLTETDTCTEQGTVSEEDKDGRDANEQVQEDSIELRRDTGIAGSSDFVLGDNNIRLSAISAGTANKQSTLSVTDMVVDDTEEQVSESSNELVSDDDTLRTNSDDGLLSRLLSKLGDFSMGSMFGTKADPNVCRGDGKSKAFHQYPCFKNLEVTEELLDSSELWSCFLSLCQGIVDVPFKSKSKQKKGGGNEKENTQGPSPAHVRNKMSGLKPRRAPLYQNCVIEAPDGEMLSTCDKRKAFWYLSRELADVVNEDPYTIRLKFEPSGRPLNPETNYYLTFKENMCVACGRDDRYMRKNIIPHDYRKHFPSCMKDHHSHDVLLLCPPCHMFSTLHDDMLRKRLAGKYDAPLASSQVARLVQDPVLKQVKCAAKALVYAGEKIPAKRREELFTTVKEYLGVENPTREMLVEASEMETRQENCDFISHGREVVRKVKGEGELLDFERMWREHFLQTMQPKFLPPLWTVDHEQEKVKRLLQNELVSEEN